MKKHNHFKSTIIATLLALSTGSWAENNKPVIKQTQQELDAINQSQSSFEIVKHDNGAESVDLKGRFQMYSVAKIVDGKVTYSCQGHDQISTPHSHTEHTKNLPKRGEK